MATVLSYGFIKPDAGDESSIQWMPDQAANWEKVNDHTHDGVNSALVSFSSLTKELQSIDSTGWVLVGDGIYSQTISMPLGFTFDNSFMVFQITSGADAGTIWYPEIVKDGANSYTIYTNDNTLEFDVRYI